MNRRGGFTLIELVVTTLLIGIIGGLLLTPLFKSVDTSLAMIANAAVRDEIDGALFRISRELRCAKAVITPPVGSVGTGLTFTKSIGCATGVDPSLTVTFSQDPLTGALIRTTAIGTVPFTPPLLQVTVSHPAGGASQQVIAVSVTYEVNGRTVTETIRVTPLPPLIATFSEPVR
jgi:prepilin-type N-terminal cleavage/methylation domain-containing protein